MSMSKSDCLSSRATILAGMQGVLSAEDFGGLSFVEGKYCDPRLSSQWWTAQSPDRNPWEFVVTNADGDTFDCYLCWSVTRKDNSHFFGNVYGAPIHLPIGWRTGALRDHWNTARTRARWRLVRGAWLGGHLAACAQSAQDSPSLHRGPAQA